MTLLNILSAMRENEAYLESIQGHIDILNNDIQTMWMNFMESDAIKWFVHLADELVKIIDHVGVLNSALLVLGTRFTFKNFDKFFDMSKLDGKINDKFFKGAYNKSAYEKTLANLQKRVEAARKAYEQSGSADDLSIWEKEKKNLEVYQKEFEKSAEFQKNKAKEVADAKKGMDQQEKVSDTTKTTGEMANSKVNKNQQIKDATDVKNAKQILDNQELQGDDAKVAGEMANSEANKNKQISDAKQVADAKQNSNSQITSSLKDMGASLKQMAVSFATTYAITKAFSLLGDVWNWISSSFKKTEDSFESMQEEYQDLNSQLSECESELSNLESQFDTVNKQIEDLESQGTLTFVEKEELERLKDVSNELERQISATETLQNSLQVGVASAAQNVGDAYLNTSFISDKSKEERQAEDSGTAKKWGEGIGLAAGAAIGFYFGGPAGASLGSTLGSFICGGIFDAAGSYFSGEEYDDEKTVLRAIRTIRADRGELVRNRDNAYEEYAEGTGSFGDFEKASNELVEYDQKMASHINQLSQYYNSIMSSWNNMTDEQKEANKGLLAQAKMYGDLLDTYNIEMGGVNATSNAISRIFGEEADEDLLRVKDALEEMAEAGDEIDLEKAFGGNTDEYYTFVRRIKDMGISVHELEESFIELYDAEIEASRVEFSDIAKDVEGVTDVINGLKSAFDEFLHMGISDPETLLSFEEAFSGTDELKDLYNEYVGIMLSGNKSIEEAREATNRLAAAYIENEIALGKLTEENKAMYIVLLTRLGIENAADFIDNKMKHAVVEDIEEDLNKHYEKQNNPLNYTGWDLNPGEYTAADAQHIVDEYGVEIEQLETIVDLLNQKKDLENQKEKEKEKASHYETWVDSYEKTLEDIELVEHELEQLRKEKDEYIDNNEDGKLEYLGNITAMETAIATKEGELVLLHTTKEGLEDVGSDKGYLENGELKEDFLDDHKNTMDELQREIDSIDSEISAIITMDYEVDITKENVENTISSLKASIEEYKSTLDILDEVLFDGQIISEDYYNALNEQLKDARVGTQDFFDAVDTSNGFVIKNAKLLKELAKQSGNVTRETIKLAKSQTRLEYYELYKEIDNLVDGTSELDDSTKDYVDSLYKEMNCLQRTIAQYSLLEAELLGAANAYSELEDAQAADQAADYGSRAEELVNVLAEAFNTSELGTEAARVAFEGIIPDDVIDKSKTLDEQMQQAYEYFTNGPVSQLFTIEFDDEGLIQGVNMTKENVQAFTESLIGTGPDAVFQGTWDEFTLNPAIKSLKDFADAIGTTEEIAFAYLTKMERYDIGNILGLGGDSLLDQLMGDNFDYQLQKAIQAAAEAERKLVDGTLKVTDQEYIDAQSNLSSKKDQALDDATAWARNSQTLNDYKTELEDLKKQYEDAYAAGEDTTEIENRISEVTENIDDLVENIRELDEPTELVLEVAADRAKEEIENIKKQIEDSNQSATITPIIKTIDDAGLDGLDELGFTKNADGVWVADGEISIEAWSQLDEQSQQLVLDYINSIEGEHLVNLLLGDDASTVETTLADVEATLTDIATILEDIARIFDPTYKLEVDTTEAENNTWGFKSIWDGIKDKRVTLTQTVKTVTEGAINFVKNLTTPIFPKDDDATNANGTAHISGTANAGGSWGAPKTETSLVGELGPEILVRGNRWTTVGENGAEFTQVKKGDIIFNHKQSESLLKNGYVTGRGKAYASGTAYLGGIDTWNKSYKNLSIDFANVSLKDGDVKPGSGSVDTFDGGNGGKKGGSGSDEKDEFQEVFDWIEVRLEELNEILDRFNAELENKVGYVDQNAKIDEIIAINEQLRDNLLAGATEYYKYAETLLAKVPAEYRKVAQDGTIAIEEFVGEADEETLKAIQEYRDWVQKGADATQQAEEVLTEISSLAKQAIDNIATQFENERSLNDAKISQFEAYNDLLETDKGFAAEGIYQAIIDENESIISALEAQRDEMQAELNKRVEAGEIQVNSQDWYDAVAAIADVDTEIINLNVNIEDLQDNINELHWAQFDLLMKQFEAVSDEASNLIDILSTKDVVDELGNWTDEGITSLGLLAQQMEVAEMQAEKYKQEIAYLEENWESLGYTQEEYVEKLEELKSGQYDSIKAYNDMKDAIVDLNKERVDAIKEGIEKEVENLEELIEKKKEALDSEKD